jgi:5-methylcytosine-specific restriction endonuclease McrA
MAPESNAQRRYRLQNRDRINSEQTRKYLAGQIVSHPRPPRLHSHCAMCSKEIPQSRRVDAKYCSQNCERGMHLQRKQARRKAGTESRETSARLRERYLAWYAANPESIKAYSQMRRARKCHVFAEHIKSVDIFERDRWTCQLCHCSTPASLIGTRSRCRPTLDHIVPLSKGGSHTYQNVQCACSACNNRKSATIRGQFRLF